MTAATVRITPAQVIETRRFRIEHASVVDPADVPRFVELGVIASMQPGFVSEYGRWAIGRLGPARFAR